MNALIKKFFTFFISFFIIFISFAPKIYADDIRNKITSANFDTSNSMIILTAQDTAEPILKDIKVVKLENPSRVYFDIDNSILTIAKQDWTFNSGVVKQVKINQFSVNPDKVRVVMYFDEEFDLNNIKFYRIKNNIIIKFKNAYPCNENYLQNVYRDEHSSSSDFYEYTTVMFPVTSPNDKTEQLQQGNGENALASTMAKKELKLNTKLYLNNAIAKQNLITLNGFGAITLEKPYLLSNPKRIVYDIPNTLTDAKIRNKEFKLNETDTAKIGQFSVNKARVVITSEDAQNYLPVFSKDNQTITFANVKKIDYKTLFTGSANVTGYSKEKNDSQTYSMVLFFDAPIVHAIDRLNERLDLYLYNVSKYSEEHFKSTFAATPFANAEVTLMPKIGIKISIPLNSDSMVSSYLGADGRTLKVKIKGPKSISSILSPVISGMNQNNKDKGLKKKIVLDPGHGGSDCGAIGGGYTVEMTRNSDVYVSLQDRVAFSEKADPDIFVSIHVNSSVKPEITGIETHYYHQESMTLAQTVHSSLASNINSPNRGLFKSKFYVINHTTVTAILVEIGFISNSRERAELIGEKRKQATAKAIAEGVENYFKQYK